MKNKKVVGILGVLCVVSCLGALQGKEKAKKEEAKVIKGKLKKGDSRVERFAFKDVPKKLTGAVTYVLPRGNGKKPAPSYTVKVKKSGVVYLLVQDRGDVNIPQGWTKTKMSVKWGGHFSDTVYTKKGIKAGDTVKVPGHQGKSGSWYGVPNMLVVPK